jgi:hypothetical protein
MMAILVICDAETDSNEWARRPPTGRGRQFQMALHNSSTCRNNVFDPNQFPHLNQNMVDAVAT